ncbi:MAG: hypothetical protein RL391_1655 [Actinomycetota bacterium]|jgi:ribosomal protein L11 methyltransferase
MLRVPSGSVGSFVASIDGSAMTLGITVKTNPADVEYVADLLWGLGASALSEHWQPDGTVILRTSLGEDEGAVTDAVNSLPRSLDWSFEDIDDAVGSEWREHAAPVWISDDLEIVPAWVDGGARRAKQRVLIEPGPTFGLGDHPTTRACLTLLTQLITPETSVLDVGCGSGVLGVTALVLGASRAIGVDISPAAIEVSQENARRNGVAERWLVTTNDLSTIRNRYDLVFANILAPTLVELSDELKRLVGPGGKLVISGVLDGHYSHVVEALEPLRVIDHKVLDGWAAVVLS